MDNKVFKHVELTGTSRASVEDSGAVRHHTGDESDSEHVVVSSHRDQECAIKEDKGRAWQRQMIRNLIPERNKMSFD